MAKRDLYSLIIEASFDLVSKYGLDKTTFKLISKEASVTEANIYYHFKTKDKLYLAMFGQVNQEIDVALRDHYVKNDLDIHTDQEATSISIWFAYLDYWVANPEKTIFYDYYIHSHYINQQIWLDQGVTFAFFTTVFRGILKNLLHSTDVFTFTLIWKVVLGSALTLAKQTIQTGQPIAQDAKEKIEETLRSFLGFQKKPDGDEGASDSTENQPEKGIGENRKERD